MKSIFITSLMALTMSSFTTEIDTTEALGRKAFEAFQKTSPVEYARLYPTLNDFYSMMERNAGVYGSTLDEAKNEFAITYAKNVLPALNDSFERIILEGNALGIDWSQAEFVRVEGNKPVGSFGAATLILVFTCKGETHKIIFYNALIFDGVWRVSQFVRLT